MVFLQLNILASTRAELLKALDELKEEIATTPSLEFFAMARTEALPHYEAVTSVTEMQTLWDARDES